MKAIGITLAALLLAGCASTTPRVDKPAAPPISAQRLDGPGDLRSPEELTRYEIGRYREPGSPGTLHEAHAVYRVTRAAAWKDRAVDARQDDATRSSYRPLPPSDELRAELDQQRQVTARLRAMEAEMAKLQHAAKAQYAALADEAHKAEALRTELQKERERLRQAESAQEDQTEVSPSGAGASP